MVDTDFKCENCGAYIKSGQKVCRFCGTELRSFSKENKNPTVKNNQQEQENFSDVEKTILASAEFMDKTAQLKLGKVYLYGLGVEKNEKIARHLLTSAALKGSGEAMYLYAKLMEKENFEKALWWYVQAAKNGSVEAQNTLGERLGGHIVESDGKQEARPTNEFKQVVNTVRPFCVELSCSSSSNNASRGTGCIISPRFIITNAHVIINESTNAPHKRIMLDFNESVKAERTEVKVVAYDVKEDIALCVFVNGEVDNKLKFPQFFDAHAVECGDKVFTIGNALGRGLALSSGVVSREVQKNAYNKAEVLQTDMSINGGNSGGALFNDSGNIIGMMTFTPLSENLRAYGMSFAVTSNTISEFIEKVMKAGG